MSELALKLIAENKKTKATSLDLGNCGLTEWPEELFECVWLEELILSNHWEEYDESLGSMDTKSSQNNEEENNLNTLPTAFVNLTQLKKLFICGSFDYYENITDLAPLNSLINLQQVDCSRTHVSDLSPLCMLTSLQYLNCADTRISDLSPISGLLNLQSLEVSSTQISDLSPISNLKMLKELRFAYTKAKELTPISEIYSLLILDCMETTVSDLSPLSGFINLEILFISGTQVVDLLPLSNLINLQHLFCDGTLVSDLTPIAKLNHLQSFWCSSTQVSDLSPLSHLLNLERLWCSNLKLTDLSPISELINLKILNCSNTQVGNLGPLYKLQNIEEIDCSFTPIDDLSPIYSLIKNGKKIYLKNSNRDINIENCPLIIPPIEFAQAGNEAILEYFDQLGEDRTPLNEIKVIFLGEGAAGKTSLVKRIRNEAFDAKESQTHGIRIQKTPFEVEDETIQAHIWDFGGQEVMHATHQFFLSQRCVYVLVLNSRTDEKAEYWLKHASSFGGNSPVLVVLNKMDENPGYDVNRKQLLEKYPQILDFYKVSCKENKGVDDFKAALTNQIARSDTRRTPFPKVWSAVKAHFADMKEDYIESEVYRRVCMEKGVEKAFSQEVLLQFLHDLGVVINFRNLKNFDTQILNPLWLTNGVYRVINSQIVANKQGLLHEDDFDAVINDKRYTEKNTTDKTFHYPKNKLEYIVRVMEVFELCSRLDAHTYVIPQLLPVDEPDFKFEGAVLHFVLRFPEFLPDSVFPRLMVKLNPYVKDNLRWRTGMVLYKPAIFNAQARIRADKEDKEIRIDLCGAEPRRFLSFIRETIREIAGDFAKLEYDEMVPVPETAEFMEYQYLIEAEKAGEKEIFVRGKGRIPISNLLNGVEEAVMRSEEGQMPVKVFVSYSHQDLDHLKELRSALSPLQRLGKLKIWDDRDINAGAEWEKEIFRELAEADIVLCMISADFISSEFCYSKELVAALAAHNLGNQHLIPIRVRKCDWVDLPIAGLQGSPTSEWITLSKDKDEAWTEVAQQLRPIVEGVKTRKVMAMKSKGH
jgi:internalin A